jgi:triacylglycerol esterase/lipase EstA (alpha/beta hydrolase family)
LPRIIILGHSIGGYVARLTPILYPETKTWIQDIITLGSPHTHPVFGWEPSIPNLHQQFLQQKRSRGELQEDQDNDKPPVLVAISGGLRDEMIPPVACNAAQGMEESLSVGDVSLS